MLISECLFPTTNFAKSVNVVLATLASAKHSALTPRKFWQKQFHAPDMEEDKMRAAGKRAQKPEREGEEETRKPRRIAPPGPQPSWARPPLPAASYALHDTTFLPLTVH